MYKKTAWAAGAALTVLAAASVAMAQQTSRKDAEAEATTIGELIVTAEKREQKLQDVPIAITAFTARQRETTGIVSIQDITNFTPGLTYNSGLDRAAIRGVGRLTNRLSSDAAVATYSDGFYTTSVAEAAKSTLIVERIEVLRGPQGTLYGRNAIGGAINVISKRPTNTKAGEARVTLGSYGLHNYELLVSGPVTDFARVQFYGQFVEQTEGYFRNVATGNRFKDAINNNYLEVQADVDVGERGHLWVKYAKPKWFNQSGNSGGNLGDREYSYNYSGVDSLTINPAFGLTQPNHVQVGTVTTNPQLQDPRTANTDFQTRIKNTGINILTAQYTQKFDAFDVKYVGGYDSYRYDQFTDSDGLPILSFQVPLNVSPAPSLNTCQYVPGCKPLTIDASGNRFSYIEDKSWFSHELNISSNQEGPFQWIAGLYYFKDTYHNPQISYSSQPGALTPSGAGVGNPLGSALNPRGEFYFFDYDMTTESRAVFGQVDWKFRDVWQFTAGLRYTADHKEGFESFRSLCMTNSCIGDPRVYGTLVGAQALDITTLLAAGYPSQAAAKVEGVTSAPSQQSATKWVNYVIDPVTGRANRQLENDWSGVTGTLGIEWNPDRGT
ncbi:MAG: TonB-dependent receptor, partial [Phenylobacterium sp.]